MKSMKVVVEIEAQYLEDGSKKTNVPMYVHSYDGDCVRIEAEGDYYFVNGDVLIEAIARVEHPMKSMKMVAAIEAKYLEEDSKKTNVCMQVRSYDGDAESMRGVVSIEVECGEGCVDWYLVNGDVLIEAVDRAMTSRRPPRPVYRCNR